MDSTTSWDLCFVKAYPELPGAHPIRQHPPAEPRRPSATVTYGSLAKIMGDGRRKRTRVFNELIPLPKDRFGRPGKGNDKGKVEGLGDMLVGTSWCPYLPIGG